MPGQNANTLYCSCWLFQYNKGRRKVYYVFLPKDANFCEQPLHAACVRESESAVIAQGTLARSGSTSRSFGLAAAVSRDAVFKNGGNIIGPLVKAV